MDRNAGIGIFLAGAAVGAALGLLFAPRPGRETRQMIGQRAHDMMDKVRRRKDAAEEEEEATEVV